MSGQVSFRNLSACESLTHSLSPVPHLDRSEPLGNAGMAKRAGLEHSRD